MKIMEIKKIIHEKLTNSIPVVLPKILAPK